MRARVKEKEGTAKAEKAPGQGASYAEAPTTNPSARMAPT